MEATSEVPQSVTRDLSKLREVTGKVVGNVFFGSMLKMMRDSKIKGTVGHGGRGEEVFSGQLHGILSERMGEKAHGGVVGALYKQLERQQQLISGRRAYANEAGFEREGSPSDLRNALNLTERPAANNIDVSLFRSAK